MGNYNGTTRDLEKIISELRNSYQGTDYHVINRNCNAFADEFLQRLLGVASPGYVNRMAFIGSFFSCLLPESMNQDPTQQQQQQQSSGGGGSSYGGNRVNSVGSNNSSSGSGSTTSGGVFRTGSSNSAVSSQPRAFSGVSGAKLGEKKERACVLYHRRVVFFTLQVHFLMLRLLFTAGGNGISTSTVTVNVDDNNNLVVSVLFSFFIVIVFISAFC